MEHENAYIKCIISQNVKLLAIMIAFQSTFKVPSEQIQIPLLPRTIYLDTRPHCTKNVTEFILLNWIKVLVDKKTVGI